MPDFSPLSIALVTGSVSRRAGGLFHSVRRSAQTLAAAGHEIAVLALDDEFAAEDLAAWAPLVPLAAKRRGSSALGYGPAITKALNAGSFDIVHQHGIWQAFSAQVSGWRRRSGGAVMISPRGMLDQWAVRNSNWKKRLAGAAYERKNIANARCLHALNLSEARSMRAFGLENPIAIIPNGTDLPSEATAAPPDWWPGGKVLLFIGRIHPKKGLAELVEAFANYARAARDTGWRLVIAGWDDGRHNAAVEAAVARHGLDGRVILPGPVHGAEKDAALRNASAFILPSHSEGLPMSVLEAWAYGLPVLMTDACNLPEGFAADAAFRIDTEPARMGGQLAAALGSAKLHFMGEKGRKLARERYSWAAVGELHTQVYHWMLAGGDAPACVRLGSP